MGSFSDCLHGLVLPICVTSFVVFYTGPHSHVRRYGSMFAIAYVCIVKNDPFLFNASYFCVVKHVYIFYVIYFCNWEQCFKHPLLFEMFFHNVTFSSISCFCVFIISLILLIRCFDDSFHLPLQWPHMSNPKES